MRKLVLTLSALAVIGFVFPIAAPAEAETIVIKKRGDRGHHYGWERGRHYGWARDHGSRRTVIIKKRYD